MPKRKPYTWSTTSKKHKRTKRRFKRPTPEEYREWSRSTKRIPKRVAMKRFESGRMLVYDPSQKRYTMKRRTAFAVKMDRARRKRRPLKHATRAYYMRPDLYDVRGIDYGD